MVDSPTHEILPGYGTQDELSVEDDYIRAGTFRSVIGVLAFLVIVIMITVQLTVHEGQQAKLANQKEGPTPASIAKTEAMRSLNRYEVVDAESGTYRIPIERAMAAEVLDRSSAR